MTEPSPPLICPSCQAEQDSQALFCLQCGEPLLEGKIAGSYRLTQRLGAGGMGVVYRAEHIRLGTPFAVKLLHRKYAKEERIAARFLREAKATSQLQHEHIVFLADYGEMDPFGPYITMEHLEGQPLADAVKGAPRLSLDHIVTITQQVAAAIRYSHRQGMVHRDLKPDNIFLMKREADEAPFVKLLDFGIAKVMEEESQELTKTGAVLGTPMYMAPEQSMGAEVDHRVDVYALSTLLFHLCTQKLPFTGNTAMEVLSQRLYQDAPLLSVYNPALRDTKLEALVAWGLFRDRDQRLPDMQVFQTTLQEAYDDLRQTWPPELLHQPLQSQATPPPITGFAPSPTASWTDPPPSEPRSGERALPSGFHSGEAPAPSGSRSGEAPLPSASLVAAEEAPSDSRVNNSVAWQETMMGEDAVSRSSSRWLWLAAVLPLLLVGGIWAAWFRPGTTPNPQNDASLAREKRSSQPRTTPRTLPSARPTTPRPPPERDPVDDVSPPPTLPRQTQLRHPARPVARPVARRIRRRRRPTVRRRQRSRRVARRPQNRRVTPLLRRVAPVRRIAARPSDGCPANSQGATWVRLRSNESQVTVQSNGKTLRRNPQAGGWCVPVPPSGARIQIDGTMRNLALCSFRLKASTPRTVRIRLLDADDQGPGSYCYRP